MVNKKTKRMRVLRDRQILRAKRKHEKAVAWAVALKQAKNNPTPKPQTALRIRTRTERQLLACAATGVIPERTAARFGILSDEGLDTDLLEKLADAIKLEQGRREQNNEAVLVSWRQYLTTLNAPKLELTAV